MIEVQAKKNFYCFINTDLVLIILLVFEKKEKLKANNFHTYTPSLCMSENA